MKNSSPILVALLLVFGGPGVRAATLDADSEIRRVTVYTDRARITREATVDLPAGEASVRFTRLPANLDESSVQAAGSGSAAFKILGIEIHNKFTAELINERVRELQAQLVVLNDEAKLLNEQKRNIGERKNFLNKIRDDLFARPLQVPEGTEPTAALSVDSVRSLYDFYGKELEQLARQDIVFDVGIRDLEPRRKVIQQELNQLSGQRSRSEKEVVVMIQTQGPVKADLSVSYNMHGASWLPNYDARVDTKTGEIELASSGMIRQQTGEEWKNVELTLSTARPGIGARMPELTPWWLSILRPVARNEKAKNAYSDEASTRARDNMLRGQVQLGEEQLQVAAAPVDADAAKAVVDNSGFSAVFQIKLPTSIPSDGEAHKVPITTETFKTDLQYVATPKLSKFAYLKARLKNTSGAPLLGGQVNLFRDGDFVGKSSLNFIADNAEFDFFLGIDDSVKITRKILLKKSGKTGLISKQNESIRKFETKIENFKTSEIKITLYGQIPISQDESIKVSNIEFSRKPSKENKETGELEWEFVLKPGTKAELTESFQVTWPFDKLIDGL
ncbi:MAG: mucoidy inhibitor MuiA family protein [Chthoniobacterales bacterium]